MAAGIHLGPWIDLAGFGEVGGFKVQSVQSYIPSLYPYIPVLSQRLVRILDAWTVDMNADHYKQKTLKSQKWC